jgi:hypothetical protein
MLAGMKFKAAILFLALTLPALGHAQENVSTNQLPTREMSVALFNHKDFTGWTFCMNGHADALKTWSVTNNVIHCTGKPIGYLRTTQVYSNYFLTVEWRFVKVAPKADNSGILINIQPPDKVWPKCVQVQGKHGRQGDLFLMAGTESKEHRGKDANTPVPFLGNSVERPVGDWNKIEVINNHNKVSVFVNGRFLNEITECTVSSGYIGIQSEGGDMEIRTIAYTPLPY